MRTSFRAAVLLSILVPGSLAIAADGAPPATKPGDDPIAAAPDGPATRPRFAPGRPRAAFPNPPAPRRIESPQSSPLVRGASGDLWADKILGKPDFSEITPNEVVKARLFNSGGVVVDRTVRPNRVYFYDGGNSRVLGMSHLGVCAGGTKIGQNCTGQGDCPGSTCTVTEGRGADIVLGQPSFAGAACNGDSNFQNYPTRAPASASRLCGLQESQISITEGGSFANMAVDSAGNLYVPDWDNNRVLRYNSPFTTDVVADYVWGQADFTGNGCNRGRGLDLPDAQSLCLRNPDNEGFVGGVAIDHLGNLWVTDNRNNRALRFPKDPSTGIPKATADLVLGQPDFFSSAKGSLPNQMWAPAAVREDSAGAIYVADSQPGGGSDSGGRVSVFRAPFSNGMNATSIIGAGQLRSPTGLELDPAGGLWVNDSANNQLLLYVNGVVQKVLFRDVANYTGACGGSFHGDGPAFVYPNGETFDSSTVCGSYGGIGVDSDGNVIASFSGFYQDAWRFKAPFPNPVPGTAHSADARLFVPYQLGDDNRVGATGLYSPRSIVLAAGQLIVCDATRVLFWNDPTGFTNGQAADGVVGGTFQGANRWSSWIRLTTDGTRLWAIRNSGLEVYALPLTTGASPVATLSNATPLPLLGGGTLAWDPVPGMTGVVWGITFDSTATRLWIADADRSRVFRVRDPLTNPIVDVVLGATSASEARCNRSDLPVDSSPPTANTLCFPGAVVYDRKGNLYVADHSLEVRGNFRLLEYNASRFPMSPSSVIWAPPADRVFGTSGSFTQRAACQGVDPLCAPWEPVFDTSNRMVVGGNGYGGTRFPLVYSNPLASQTPDASLADYSSMSYGMAFDASNNLFVADLDRARVLFYKTPFPPTITGISPASGPSSGGTSVTITGSSLETGATVRVDGFPAAVTGGTPPTTLVATMPPHVAGVANVTVTTPGGTSAPIPFTYRGFWVACSPSSLSVKQGANGSTVCTVTSRSGFASPVTLGCASPPTGVTCAFAPASVTPPANGTVNSTLTVSASLAAAVATSNLQVTGTSGGIVQSTTVVLSVGTASGLVAAGLTSDAHSATGTVSNLDSVFEPGETAVVEPAWTNLGSPVALTSSASGFGGPGGAVYTIVDGAASFGTIASGATANCYTATAPHDCFVLRISNPASRPVQHWDASFTETLSAGGSVARPLHVGQSFSDVPTSNPYYRQIETLFHNGVTGGCGGTNYCPSTVVSRAQMSVFLLVSKFGPAFSPPAAVGLFNDVPVTSPFARWIEYLYRYEVTAGCGTGLFCPDDPVTRGQMAVFLLKTKEGPGYVPPPAKGTVFADVPVTHPFAKWIEEIARRGITAGCGGGNYCPDASTTRDQMAVFLVSTFGLRL